MEKSLKSVAILFAALVALEGVARADELADRIAAAREVMAATHAADRMQEFVPLMFKQLRGVLVQANPKAEQEIDLLLPRYEERAKARTGELVQAIAAIYAKRFTTTELKEVAAFWKSPVGQKFATEQAGLMKEAMEIGNNLGQSIAKDALEEMKAELRKKGYDL
jgi:hypothetical protein